jgi:hypothetical protein
MRFREVKAFLTASRDGPTEPDERVKWLEGRDVPNFLESSVSEDVPIYVSRGSLYLYGAFIPAERLTGDWVKQGLTWNFSVPEGWGYGYRNDRDGNSTPAIFPPLNQTGSELLDRAEPLIFWRRLEGRGQPYMELNQRFAHVAGIHRIEERGAYCRVDDNGDIENVVVTERTDSGWTCTARRSALDFYMFLTDSVLVRVFDVIRPLASWDGQGRRTEAVVKHPSQEIFARQTLLLDESGLPIRGTLRGFQVVRRGMEDEKLWKVLRGEPLEPKQYETFLINDWKTKSFVEWSCDPAELGNYFVKSDLPYSTSPVFFRPEVLSKYKQNPEKYDLDVRSVSCRGIWTLRSFDINEEGQVHAYIGDLGDLPYPEQLHWKQFNEPPKAGISKRAFQTDFEASWDVEPDPVWELKAVLREFPPTNEGRIIWSTHGTEIEKALANIQHVVTDSPKEWRDVVLDLCRLVVDGLETANLRELASSLGCDDKKLGSLKLLRRVLHARSVDANVISEACDPLDALQAQRSSKSAHGVSADVPANTREDFRSRLEAVEHSVRLLADLIRQGVLDLEPRETVDA